jgi:hypothetical protein
MQTGISRQPASLFMLSVGSCAVWAKQLAPETNGNLPPCRNAWLERKGKYLADCQYTLVQVSVSFKVLNIKAALIETLQTLSSSFASESTFAFQSPG